MTQTTRNYARQETTRLLRIRARDRGYPSPRRPTAAPAGDASGLSPAQVDDPASHSAVPGMIPIPRQADTPPNGRDALHCDTTSFLWTFQIDEARARLRFVKPALRDAASILASGTNALLSH